jgi:hypothetical protein
VTAERFVLVIKAESSNYSHGMSAQLSQWFARHCESPVVGTPRGRRRNTWKHALRDTWKHALRDTWKHALRDTWKHALRDTWKNALRDEWRLSRDVQHAACTTPRATRRVHYACNMPRARCV